MKQITVTILNNVYPVKFGYGAIRTLGTMWGLNGFTEVVEKVGGLVPKDGDTAEMLKFDSLEALADVVWAGVLNAAKPDDAMVFERGDVVDAFFQDMNILKEVFELFMASMPQQKQPVEPPKKKRTAKK